MTNEVKILIGFGLVTVVLFVGGLLLFGGGAAQKQTATADLLVKESSIQTGPKNAKVSVVEFADFQCPACAAAAPILTQLRSDYKDQVNFVFRHFPLPSHSNARIAAEAAEAAGDQGKFWEMGDLLYSRQKDWQSQTSPQEVFRELAQSLGLDLQKFDKALADYAHISRINGDKSDGDSIGVRATPTFFINGQKTEGVIPYNNFKNLIDQELKK